MSMRNRCLEFLCFHQREREAEKKQVAREERTMVPSAFVYSRTTSR